MVFGVCGLEVKAKAPGVRGFMPSLGLEFVVVFGVCGLEVKAKAPGVRGFMWLWGLWGLKLHKLGFMGLWDCRA